MPLRQARPEDEDALYDVCLKTAWNGDGTAMYDDPRLLGHLFVGPYLHLEPEHAFTLDVEGPCGYLFGVVDTASFEERCEREWWPALRERYPLDVSRRDTDQDLVRAIHHPDRDAGQLERLSDYPSHLHIDLLPRVQGFGYGPRMLSYLFEVLAAAGSPGVHLGTGSGNARARRVYERLGFQVLQDDGDSVVMVRPLP